MVKFLDNDLRITEKVCELCVISNSNIKEIFSYSEKTVSQKKFTRNKFLSSVLKSVGNFVDVARVSTCFMLSITEFGLIGLSMSTGVACGSSSTNKVSFSKIYVCKKHIKTNLRALNC